jgi:hypothetical protein
MFYLINVFFSDLDEGVEDCEGVVGFVVWLILPL